MPKVTLSSPTVEIVDSLFSVGGPNCSGFSGGKVVTVVVVIPTVVVVTGVVVVVVLPVVVTRGEAVVVVSALAPVSVLVLGVSSLAAS